MAPLDPAPADESAFLDLSSDTTRAPLTAPREGAPYDPRPFEDTARRYIAYALLALLALLLLLIFAFLGMKIISVSDLKEFNLILGPVVTLVSAATGFYYGTKSQ